MFRRDVYAQLLADTFAHHCAAATSLNIPHCQLIEHQKYHQSLHSGEGGASAPVSALLLLHGCQQSRVEAGLGGPLSRISLSTALRGVSSSLGRSLMPAHLPRPLARRGWRRLLASPCEAVNTLVHALKSKNVTSILHVHTLRCSERKGKALKQPPPASKHRRSAQRKRSWLAPSSPTGLIAVTRQHGGHVAAIDSQGCSM